MRRLLLLGVMWGVLGAPAAAVTLSVRWDPPTTGGVLDSQPDPIVAYRLWQCDGAACAPTSPVQWQEVQTYPAAPACASLPCAGTHDVPLAPEEQRQVSFYMTAESAGGQTSVPSNVIARTLVNSPDRPPGPPEQLRFAFSTEGMRTVDVLIQGSGRVLLAKHEPLVNAGEAVLLRVVDDRRRLRDGG